MPQLIILGAGPHAQEMAHFAMLPGADIRAAGAPGAGAGGWSLLGFLVPETEVGLVGERMGSGHRALDTYTAIDAYPDAAFAVEYGCGAPPLPPERLASLIAPTAFVAAPARIGAGCVIYPGCFVGHNAVLGERVFALAGAVVNHDNVLEDDVTVCSGTTLAGHVHVEAGCYLGQACTIRQYLRIGQGSLIGMGAVVLADVAPNSVMVGNPARRLRARVER